jgi:cytochrome c6
MKDKTLSHVLVGGVLFLALTAFGVGGYLTLPQAAVAGQASAADPSGSQVFATYCAPCHPNGGNTIDPNKPLQGAPELGSYSSFKSFVRQSHKPMPPFTSSEISDADLQKLYNYLSSAYGG